AEFWEGAVNPSLKKFLDFRFQKGVLRDKKTEYSQYKSELDTIKRYYSGTSECSVQYFSAPSLTTCQLRLAVGKDYGQLLEKKSQTLIPFWDLQTKRQAIHMESKILEEKAQLQQRPCEEDVPSTPPEKIRAVNEESSTSAMSYIPAIPVESSTSKDPVIDTKDEDVFNMMLRETYLKIRQDIRSCISQRDWNIEDYNVSRSFRDYQITNVNKLEDDVIFFFSSDIEEIL
ncbi:1543_t:CDS:2, partial [Funneliformis geosporum]